MPRLSRFLARCASVAGLILLLWCTAVLTSIDRHPAMADDWVWPLDGPHQIGRAFQPPLTPYGPGHRGVDLLGAAGDVVHAAGAGTVAFAGVLAGRGVVSIAHPDGLRTTYEPITATVSAGDEVSVGAPIGQLEPGHAGCPAAACLHWGLRRGETYLDPLSLVGSGQVRLYPRFGADLEPSASGRAPPPVPQPTVARAAADGQGHAMPAIAAAATVAGAGAAVWWWRGRRG